MEATTKLFGSRARSEVLLAVALLKESYARELARVLRLPLLTVQRVLNAFEKEGVLVSRLVGSNRIFTLNRKMYAGSELEAFLIKYSNRTNLTERLGQFRRRPRRKGKEL
jgi:DNA-binding transcriptional ArsR family regulator